MPHILTSFCFCTGQMPLSLTTSHNKEQIKNSDQKQKYTFRFLLRQNSFCTSVTIHMCGKPLFSQHTSPSYQTTIVSTFCRTKIYIYKYINNKSSVKNIAPSVINQVSDCSDTRIQVLLVVFFTFFYIYFHSSFLSTHFSLKMLGNVTVGLIFFILLHSAYLYTKEIKMYIYLVIESNHFSNNTFINSRKQRIPNKLHIFC